MKHPVLNLNTSLQLNIIRLMGYYNTLAIQHLSRKTLVNTHVHQARLCCKRIRSILRLARPAVEKNTYLQYNSLYRDASRKLAKARDLTALSETIDSLVSKTSSSQLASFFKKEKRSLLRERRILMQSHEFQNAQKEVSTIFANAEMNLESIVFSSHEIAALFKGLVNTYDKGRRFLEINMNRTDSHLMHEWRKQVKYTWYQLVVLEPIWPEIFKALIGEFQALSKLLGNYQDLTLLEEYLKEQRNKSKSSNVLASGLRLITIKKKDLAKRSLHLGKRLYSLPHCKDLSGWLHHLLYLQQQMD